VKYKFIYSNRAWINVSIACETLKACSSGYYAWLSSENERQKKLQKEAELVSKIIAAHNTSQQRFGYRGVTRYLNEHGIDCYNRQILKLMRKHGLRSKVAKKFKATTNSSHDLPVFDNVLNRVFDWSTPNKAWVSDITYVATEQGWLYLATVIDLYSRKVVGYAMSDRMKKDLVIAALNNALAHRGNPTRVIVHSDRGSQYASTKYRNLLEQNGLIGSMSRKGNCWDNAIAENFFGIIKKEFINHCNFKTREEAKLGIFNYIETWYNQERYHSKLGYLSPNKFELKNIGVVQNLTEISKISETICYDKKSEPLADGITVAQKV
jgi:putative transposase